jgi:hypothetical protein
MAALAWAQPAAKDTEYQPRLDKDGYHLLMDGKDLAAWRVQGMEQVWVIDEQGVLAPVKGGGTLFTKLRYCDYVLELETKIAANAKSNSGIFIRVHDRRQEVNTGMEIQILDNAAYGAKWDAYNAMGALYGLVKPAVDANVPLGEWNKFKITLNGGLINIELNGKEIVKADLDNWTTAKKNPDGTGNKFPHPIAALPREGFIGLQNYGGKAVWFRNVRLKPLSDRKPEHTGDEPIAQVLRKVEAK